MEKYILSIDQGTTSSRAMVFDLHGRIKSASQQEFGQIFPRPGWVEHDPMEIWTSQLSSIKEALAAAGLKAGEVQALGISNQRETTVLWERDSGKPVYNAIVWQCRRTAELCRELKNEGLEGMVREKTGLIIDPYFAATKLLWLFREYPDIKKRSEKGEICFGTVDSWLIYMLTGEHLTDASNASRTLLFNIHTGKWDEDILKAFHIPLVILPRVVPSSGLMACVKKGILGAEIPVAGCAGDQQAALFGQGCFKPGEAKNTYGTGCFTLMNTGKNPVHSQNGLLTTVAWDLGHGLEYALEGSVFMAGAVIQWLRDSLGIIRHAADSHEAALSVPDTGGVYLVPAFVGLGAPHWDPDVRGSLFGLTRGSSSAHIIRAALESIAYQSYDLLKAMEKDSGEIMPFLKVDGGATANRFLMQFQADILGIAVQKPVVAETTALGAAYLAGLGMGFWNCKEDIQKNWQLDHEYQPRMSLRESEQKRVGWAKAVEASKVFRY